MGSLLFLLAGAAQAEDIYIDPDDGRGFQQALDAAVPGDVFYLPPGATCFGDAAFSVDVDNLTFKGTDGEEPTLFCPVMVRATGVRFENIALDRAASGSFGTYGWGRFDAIVVYDGAEVTFDHLFVDGLSGADTLAWVGEGARLTLDHVDIRAVDVGDDGLIQGNGADLIHVNASTFRELNDTVFFLNNVGDLDIVNSDFEDITATQYAAVAYVVGANKVTLNGARLERLASYGGAVQVQVGDLFVSDSSFLDISGGTLFATGGVVDLYTSSFTRVADEFYYGGGLYAYDADVLISGVEGYELDATFLVAYGGIVDVVDTGLRGDAAPMFSVSTTTLKSERVRSCGGGQFISSYDTEVALVNTEIRGAVIGLEMSGGDAFLWNNTFVGGQSMLRFLPNTKVEVVNNVFQHNTTALSASDSTSFERFDHNLFFDNYEDHGAIKSGDGTLYESAEFQDSFDLDDCNSLPLLSGDSPAIDAGDASVLDPDGSPSDMGAYGGAGAAQPEEGNPETDAEFVQVWVTGGCATGPLGGSALLGLLLLARRRR